MKAAPGPSFSDIQRLTQAPGPSQWPHRPQAKLGSRQDAAPSPAHASHVVGLKDRVGKDTARDRIMIQMINYIYTVNKYQ